MLVKAQEEHLMAGSDFRDRTQRLQEQVGPLRVCALLPHSVCVRVPVLTSVHACVRVCQRDKEVAVLEQELQEVRNTQYCSHYCSQSELFVCSTACCSTNDPPQRSGRCTRRQPCD